MIKKCTKCCLEKPIEEFSKAKGRKDGYREVCKLCRNLHDSSKNYEPSNILEKSCRKCKLDKSINNFHFNRRNLDGYEKDCKECRQIKTKEQYIKNGEKIREKRLEYYYSNKEIIKVKRLVYQKKRLKEDPFFKLQRNLRNRLYYALKNTTWKKNTHFSEYIGCERALLISHIESQFTLGMSWDNYGEFEIDHIIPLASANTEEELYKLCHYTNLQPLWKEENASKGAKLTT